MMKKIVSLLLVVLLLTGTVSALADEIIWQNIPWTSTKDEVLKTVIENQWIAQSDEMKYGSAGDLSEMGAGVPAFIVRNQGLLYLWDYYKEIMMNNDIHLLTTNIWKTAPNLTVGGYAVKALGFTFAPDHTLMTIGLPLLCPNGEEETFIDLSAKLKSLYGGNEFEYQGEPRYISYGDNETAVVLQSYEGELYLAYGRMTVETALGIHVETDGEAVPVMIDSNNTSGL